MKFLKIVFLLSIFSIFLIMHPQNISAGPAFHPELASGIPVPLEQNGLVLENAHIIIKDKKITAKFIIKNPSEKTIKAQMGLPADCAEKKWQISNASRLSGYEPLDQAYQLSLSSKATYTKPEVIHDIQSKYPIVYTWRMVFPPKELSEFEIKNNYITRESDEGDHYFEYFVYVITTGSYWKTPLSRIIVEYYNPELIALLGKLPNMDRVQWENNGDMERRIGIDITPKGYKIDNEKKSIIWDRENWIPKDYNDNISITIDKRQTGYIGEGCYIGNSRDDFVANMCGKGYRPGKHIGEAINFSKTISKEEMLGIINNEISRQSFTWDGEVDYTIYPVHIKTDLQLLVLRYLRNYIYATHGYEFKDKKIDQCFNNVPKKKKWGEAEQKNINLITEMEQEIKLLNHAAWQKIKESMKNNIDIDVYIEL